MPPPCGAAVGFFGSGFSTTTTSVVSTKEAMEEAFSRAKRVTLAGSTIPAFTRSSTISLSFFAWPVFMRALNSGEMSQNAGGLIRWPVWFLLPAGFTILLLQALSELIKRIAFLTGHRKEPFSDVDGKSDEELLAEELAEAAAKHELELAAAAKGR